jgi:hypothetical protein
MKGCLAMHGFRGWVSASIKQSLYHSFRAVGHCVVQRRFTTVRKIEPEIAMLAHAGDNVHMRTSFNK